MVLPFWLWADKMFHISVPFREDVRENCASAQSWSQQTCMVYAQYWTSLTWCFAKSRIGWFDFWGKIELWTSRVCVVLYNGAYLEIRRKLKKWRMKHQFVKFFFFSTLTLFPVSLANTLTCEVCPGLRGTGCLWVLGKKGVS